MSAWSLRRGDSFLGRYAKSSDENDWTRAQGPLRYNLGNKLALATVRGLRTRTSPYHAESKGWGPAGFLLRLLNLIYFRGTIYKIEGRDGVVDKSTLPTTCYSCAGGSSQQPVLDKAVRV